MIGNEAHKSGRSLAEIEHDLIKAEEAFEDADTRFKEALEDRRTAINTIDKHQRELDECILALRQNSVPGTTWRPKSGQSDEPLELHSEDIVTETDRNAVPKPKFATDELQKSKLKDTEILGASAPVKSDDPVLKVVSSPRV